ncbi:MAG: acetylornithine deacetylase [Pseudomonadales bacterium]|nr:acetylornithine deacetylase [Pseudomonadales bacterium]
MPNLPSFHQRLQALLSTASVSSVSASWDMGNRKVIDLLADWFQSLGFAIEIQPLGEHKANLIATLGDGDGGLVLAGHTDTVPFNESLWDFDPLAATEADNRIYGLGSCDMKGFFSVIIEAVLPLVDAASKLQQPLIILATADEESSMSGARALSAASLRKPRAAVIGEPTGLKPIHSHKSIMMHAINIQGQSGHSSNPALGHSALDAMSDVLMTIRQFREELAQHYQNPVFEVQTPTLNLGCIHGGDNPNRICNQCALHFDFRGLPGMSNQAILNQLEQRLAPIATAHQVELKFESLIDGVNAFFQDSDSELIQRVESLTGQTAGAVAFATEAPFLKALNINTVVMGPGSIDQAHQPNEYLALDQIQPAVTILQQLIDHYCVKPRNNRV